MKQKHRDVQVAEEFCLTRALTQSLALSVVLCPPVVIIFHCGYYFIHLQ